MKPLIQKKSPAAFTLVELLVVIAIIGVLSGLLFPVMSAVKKNQYKSTARAEMKLIEAAIENYKLKYNTYPPCNPNNAGINPLYYELLGATNNSGYYHTLDNAAVIPTTSYAQAFNNYVKGIANVTVGSGDDSKPAVNFFPGLKANMVGTIQGYSGIYITNLITSVGGPDIQALPVGGNPFHYICPGTNNPNSYDLWVDLVIKRTTNHIGNWTDH